MGTLRTCGTAQWRCHWLVVRSLGIAVAALLVAAAPAAAEVEWCDAGSPPPNDYRLRPTGTGSITAPPEWLRSTTGGAAILATYQATGTVDLTQVAALQGGVASGMAHATAAQAGAPQRPAQP